MENDSVVFMIDESKVQCCICNSIIENSENPKCPKCGTISTVCNNILDFSKNNFISANNCSTASNLNKYIFIFSHSIEVTDIQYQELFQLIKRYSTKNVAVKFEQIKNNNYSFDKLEPDDDCLVEILPFRHSCFVRSSCDIDIKTIVKNAGYIQSAGKSIYIHEWSDSRKDNILEEIKKYSKIYNKRFDLIFYTDQEEEGDKNKNKLTNIMIDHQRTYIENEFFYNRKKDITRELKDFFDESGYNNDPEIVLVYRDIIRPEANAHPLYLEQNDKHFMIIYHSQYKKENPFHELNEDRPYWAGIYTTPHTLTSAMVNIAKIETGDIVYDPFLHMGTTAIEAAKYDCIILGSDISEPIGARDNFNFVYNENFEKMVNDISKLLGTKIYDECVEILGNCITLGDTFPDFTPVEQLIEKYPNLERYEVRLLFYILRRYYLRQFQGFNEAVTDIKFVEDRLIKFKTFMEINKLNKMNPDGWKPNHIEEIKPFLNDSKYNTNRIGPQKHPNSSFQVLKSDAKKFPLVDNSVDVIITDPPYGYGDDIVNLKELYIEFLGESLRVLKPKGRLVMCILDKVKTGKKMLDDTTTMGVIDTINTIAKKRNISFIKEDIIPISGRRYLNYWKSKHALNRSILSLEIVKSEGI